MKFEEALQLMREGKKITRLCFSKSFYSDERFYYSLNNFHDYKGTYISLDDINSDDWEIVEWKNLTICLS